MTLSHDHYQMGFFLKHITGQYNLARTFWLNYIAPVVLLAAPMQAIQNLVNKWVVLAVVEQTTSVWHIVWANLYLKLVPGFVSAWSILTIIAVIRVANRTKTMFWPSIVVVYFVLTIPISLFYEYSVLLQNMGIIK